MVRSYNQVAGRRLDRLAALSDGVFAIAMTLIVLEIHVPDPGPIRSEQDLWNAQQVQINHLTTADRDLAWLHLAFLATVALMPFSTSLLAEFITFRLALVAYWANILLLGVLVYIAWVYAEAHGLLDKDAGPAVSRLIKRRIYVAQALYAFGALLCIANPLWSIVFIVLVQLNFAIAPKIPFLARL